MKFIVLNGSPKGDISVTMQYIKYIEKKFKNHEFKISNISQKVSQIEKDNDLFESIINEISSCDGVIWAFPLYIGLVASQFKRFIELIFERSAVGAFKDKYTCVLTTSINFYDHTAINYMNSICDDLGMRYIDYISLKMYDLQKEDVRINLCRFFENYFDAIEEKKTTSKSYNPVLFSPIEYTPEVVNSKIDVSNKKVIIIADSLKNDNLNNMIEKFRSLFLHDIELVLLQDIDIKGGCLGCLKCGYDYQCAYTGKDGFIDFYNSKVKTADIIIFAGEIKDRYLSSLWKKYFDRSFFNTHTPSLTGKQIGFLISGALRQVPNLKQILEAYAQWQKANLAGFITDEYETSKEIDEQIYALGSNIVKLSMTNYSKPQTFLGVGGWKIFRDEMWGELRFPFVADHKAYKALGVYDFPQKNFKARIMSLVLGSMAKIPAIRKEIYSDRTKTEMIQSLKKIVDEAE